MNKNNFEIANILEKGGQREDSNGVLIEKDKTVANNGEVLLEMSKVKGDGAGAVHEKDIILSKRECKRLMVLHKYSNNITFDELMARNDKDILNGDYPDYKVLYPDLEPVLEIGLSSKYLKQICDIAIKMQDIQNGGEMIRFKFYDSKEGGSFDKPVEFSTKNNETGQVFKGLIAPMYLDDK